MVFVCPSLHALLRLCAGPLCVCQSVHKHVNLCKSGCPFKGPSQICPRPFDQTSYDWLALGGSRDGRVRAGWEHIHFEMWRYHIAYNNGASFKRNTSRRVRDCWCAMSKYHLEIRKCTKEIKSVKSKRFRVKVGRYKVNYICPRKCCKNLVCTVYWTQQLTRGYFEIEMSLLFHIFVLCWFTVWVSCSFWVDISSDWDESQVGSNSEWHHCASQTYCRPDTELIWQ